MVPSGGTRRNDRAGRSQSHDIKLATQKCRDPSRPGEGPGTARAEPVADDRVARSERVGLGRIEGSGGQQPGLEPGVLARSVEEV